MILHFQTIRDAFPFLRQVITDAYKTDVYFHTYPYPDKDKIDRGFRRMMWGEQKTPSIFLDFLADPSDYQMAVIKSSLGYYNIFAVVSLEDNYPEFITIGPFGDGTLSATFVHQLIHNRNLSAEQAFMVEKFYEILPAADVNDLTFMVLHLLSAFIPEYHKVTPQYITYSEKNHSITPNQEAFHFFSTASSEYYARYLNDFLTSLETGSYKDTAEKLKIFLDANGTTHAASVYQLKKRIHELNAFCKEKLLTLPIHPYYPLRLADRISGQIDAMGSFDELAGFPYKMIREYCMLIENNSHPEYSYLIRSVVAYIDQHIEEELSLSVLAKVFQKNASFLSAQFRKETGVSVTEYIHKAKIRTAVQYFQTTQLSVTEVANRVGIPNFGYFSRLFKEQMGMSPRDYRKTVSNDELHVKHLLYVQSENSV